VSLPPDDSDAHRNPGERVGEEQQSQSGVQQVDHRGGPARRPDDPPVNECEERHPGRRKRWKSRAGRFNAWMRRHGRAIEAGAAIMMLVFTGALVATSVWQWQVGRDAAVAAKDAAAAALEANRQARLIEAPDVIATDAYVDSGVVTVVLKNAGRTTAKDVRLAIWFASGAPSTGITDSPSMLRRTRSSLRHQASRELERTRLLSRAEYLDTKAHLKETWRHVRKEIRKITAQGRLVADIPSGETVRGSGNISTLDPSRPLRVIGNFRWEDRFGDTREGRFCFDLPPSGHPARRCFGPDSE
jgi:hypothetical protein